MFNVAINSPNINSTTNSHQYSCRRQFSKYTCPTCNIPYCSLTCFRSEAHSQCSETFYRKEVETGIHSEPTKSAEEKMKMLELLKRLEQQSLEEDQDLLEGNESDGDVDADLAQRIGDVDFGEQQPTNCPLQVLDVAKKFSRFCIIRCSLGNAQTRRTR